MRGFLAVEANTCSSAEGIIVIHKQLMAAAEQICYHLRLTTCAAPWIPIGSVRAKLSLPEICPKTPTGSAFSDTNHFDVSDSLHRAREHRPVVDLAHFSCDDPEILKAGLGEVPTCSGTTS